jgi:hypothetical protein
MRKVHLVIIVFEGYREGKSLVEASTLLLHAVLVIAYIFAISLPPNPALLLCLSFRIYQRLHALVVGALRLDQINKVELIRNPFASVAHFEEVPLSVIVSSIIILEDKVVFKISDLDSTPQVSRFKPALEDEGGV